MLVGPMQVYSYQLTVGSPDADTMAVGHVSLSFGVATQNMRTQPWRHAVG